MKRRKSSDELNIERTLGAVNEGTPSFDKVQFTGQLSTSNITLRFHYYKDNKVDQQAIGVYEGEKFIQEPSMIQRAFGSNKQSKWSARPDDNVNKRLIDLGFKGNIGSRQKFEWNQKTYYLLEA